MDATPPPESLRLSWVYGFRGYDTRRTALWSSADDGFVVYTAAALVVSTTQAHFKEHTDDVLGLTVHRGRGGRMRKPTIWVWDARSLEVVERSIVFTGCNLGSCRVVSAQVLKGPLVFTGCNQRWVSQLAFTPSGDTLCSVGADDDHLLVLRSSDSSASSFSSASLRNTRAKHGEAPARLVLVGKGFARVYRTELLPDSHGTRLALPGRERAAALLSVGFGQEGECVVGSATGALHAFELETGRLVTSVKGAHAGPVHVVAEGPGGRLPSMAPSDSGRARLSPSSSEPPPRGNRA
ncbi:hypothetical protein EMIHUDRAFT_220632 [Emiliania huxleyi CCMP1516]|uniref:HELP domain-containing protein n=2 Tax=Emiliania huxleyi TaxID=2903 RepID=A0A0D3I0R4_EMIH1|nr:hypothetical protein EMIHUDRAFT_220632 [Emiliania huxleyi CCMP1516]EOD04849.1 hypothetical protein EMIHUDRAFT_220632 [Emiliania huxleyi CCMP1516]|eukprot:XP_005757278.1 hypothetical protein EMIHUDRAFT_220632 [Emiliania huxleyi CCMP1516]